MARLHYNLVRTALSGAINDTVTTFTITAPLREGGNLGALIPDVSGGDVLAIRVDDEIMHVTAYTSGSTTITTVARGQEDTVAAAHADGAVLKHVIAKDDLGASGASAELIGLTSYKPGTETDTSTTNTTATDVDATNLVVTFTVPASGSVLVRLSALCHGASNGIYNIWSLREGSGNVAGSDMGGGVISTASQGRTRTVKITGLTPGESKTWKWAQRTSNGANSVTTRCGDIAGPAVMEVWAA